jgi:hypothetical protein
MRSAMAAILALSAAPEGFTVADLGAKVHAMIGQHLVDRRRQAPSAHWSWHRAGRVHHHGDAHLQQPGAIDVPPGLRKRVAMSDIAFLRDLQRTDHRRPIGSTSRQ